MEFIPFPKMARLNRECVITEKIDGTNAQICIVPATDVFSVDTRLAVVPGDAASPGSVTIFAGSRNRWLSPGADNYGFAAWVRDNAQELAKLGPGRHFGEWWGAGIQRRYGLSEKRFSLFNVGRWTAGFSTPDVGVLNLHATPLEQCPACCSVVPVLYQGSFNTLTVELVKDSLRSTGSKAAPGFMQPEGVVVYHTAAGIGFKSTLENDSVPKSTV